MKRLLLASAIIAVTAGGCPVFDSALRAPVGHFAMTKGGFNEALTIDFGRDETYVLRHVWMPCTAGPNGDWIVSDNREEGIWKFDDGIVILKPKARTKDFIEESLFAPSFARKLVTRRDSKGRFLANADYPEHFILRESEKPKDPLLLPQLVISESEPK